MKNKNKFLLILPALAILATVGAASASANGMFGWMGQADPEKIAEVQDQKFTHQAEVLGLNKDEVKEYWSEGKNMRDIMEEKGMDADEVHERMQQERKEMLTQRMNSLVEAGIITQDQADERIENIGERGFGQGMGMKGMRGEERRDGVKKGGCDCPFSK